MSRDSRCHRKFSDLPEPECVRFLSHCAAERSPHTLYLQHTQRVVRGAAGFYCAHTPASRVETFSLTLIIQLKGQHFRSSYSDSNNKQEVVLCVPALCWDLTNLVARSTQTIRQPVTFGSSVPLCPVFSTRKILLIHATTS